MYKDQKGIIIENQSSKNDKMYPNLDDELLTPENFKSLRPNNPNTQKTPITRHESLPTIVQQFSPKNDGEINNGLSININRKKSKETIKRASFHEVPQNGGKTPTRDTERFAGAAFSNSPSPSSLPIPKFEGNSQTGKNNDISNVQPTRLSFSPPSKENNKQPKSILKNGTRNSQRNNNSPTKKAILPKRNELSNAQ